VIGRVLRAFRAAGPGAERSRSSTVAEQPLLSGAAARCSARSSAPRLPRVPDAACGAVRCGAVRCGVQARAPALAGPAFPSHATFHHVSLVAEPAWCFNMTPP
jgi:hypothetical protein